jgi:hypothetical protein
MQSVRFFQEQIVRAGHYAYLELNGDEKSDNFNIAINAHVQGQGKDLSFFVASKGDFKKWAYWKAHPQVQKTDSQGNRLVDKQGYPIYLAVPAPKIKAFVKHQTNLFKESLELSRGEYVLVLDNTYSRIVDKSLELSLTIKWNLDSPLKHLPVIGLLESEIPEEVIQFLKKADECYVSGHYVQCSVMLRKAVESSIRIKLLQSSLNQSDLLDSEGNEISLARKVELLRKNFLIPAKHSKDLENVKWFGDIGAHDQMEIVMEDIRDNVEPKLRSFLLALNLKA